MHWRTVGLTYLRYSQIAAATLRECAKKTSPSAKSKEASLKVTYWENGIFYFPKKINIKFTFRKTKEN